MNSIFFDVLSADLGDIEAKLLQKGTGEISLDEVSNDMLDRIHQDWVLHHVSQLNSGVCFNSVNESWNSFIKNVII